MPIRTRPLALAVAAVVVVGGVASAQAGFAWGPSRPAPSRPLAALGAGVKAAATVPVLRLTRNGQDLGTVQGIVTLAGPVTVADGSRVTFALSGPTRTTLAATAAPYQVSLDTGTLANGRYVLTVAVRGTARGSVRSGRLTVANPAGTSPTTSPSATPTGSPSSTTTTVPVTTTTAAASTTTTTTSSTTTNSTTTTTTTSTTTTRATTSSTTAVPSYAAEVVRLTNAQRVANGCPELTIDATLTQVAQAHSEDMAAQNYFDHTSLDGRSPFQRMTDAGYRYSTAAENIAAGYATPDAVVTGWMNSSGHRANILNCSLKQIGVGYATSTTAQYRTYWTQDFGTPR